MYSKSVNFDWEKAYEVAKTSDNVEELVELLKSCPDFTRNDDLYNLIDCMISNDNISEDDLAEIIEETYWCRAFTCEMKNVTIENPNTPVEVLQCILENCYVGMNFDEIWYHPNADEEIRTTFAQVFLDDDNFEEEIEENFDVVPIELLTRMIEIVTEYDVDNYKLKILLEQENVSSQILEKIAWSTRVLNQMDMKDIITMVKSKQFSDYAAEGLALFFAYSLKKVDAEIFQSLSPSQLEKMLDVFSSEGPMSEMPLEKEPFYSIVSNESVSAGILEVIAKYAHKFENEVLKLIVNHPKASATMLDSIVKCTDSTELCKLIASSSIIHPNTLNELSKHDDVAVLKKVAKNPLTPSDALSELSINFDAGVRRAVASNVKASKDILGYLCMDDDPEVSKRAYITIGKIARQNAD